MKSGRSGAHKPDRSGLSGKANKCSYAGLLPTHEIDTAQSLNLKKTTKFMESGGSSIPCPIMCKFYEYHVLIEIE